MRKRFPITLAAGGRWPDAQTGSPGFRFNWVKIDNRGTGPVDVALSGKPAAGDLTDTLLTVGAGKVRVFNVASPKDHEGKVQDDWPDEINLVSALGSTVLLELADHPIVDMDFAT